MGAGFKDFASGAILTAGDVDNYLMRQTVMTFADASARDTALSAVLDEGMVAYLEDTDTVTVYDGSAWNTIGGGSATAFTPSWTNLTPGNATESWYYVQIGDFVHVYGDTTFGSTTSVGGPVVMAVPVGSISGGGAVTGTPLGRFRLTDTDAGPALIMATAQSQATVIGIYPELASGTYVVRGSSVSTTYPFTWATSDRISGFFAYQIA